MASEQRKPVRGRKRRRARTAVRPRRPWRFDLTRLRRFIAGGIAVAVALLVAYAALHLAMDRTAAEHIARAHAHERAGDLYAATAEFRSAVERDPGHVEAHWLLARTYLRLFDGAGALHEIKQLQHSGRRSMAVQFAELRALLLEQRYEEVLARLAVFQAADDTPTVHLLRGQARIGLRRYTRARDAFREALRHRPGSGEAARGLARAALGLRDRDEADRIMDTAIAAAPGDFAAWMLKGEIRLDRGDAAGAVAAFTRATALPADRLRAQLALAGAYIVQREHRKAYDLLSGIVEAHPKHPAAHLLAALMAREDGDLEQAESELRQILARRPDHAPTLLLMAAVKYQRGDLLQAEEHLLQYGAQRPGETSATRLLAQVYLEQGRPESAVELLSAAVEAAPRDANLLAMLGGIYARTQGDTRAAELLSRAVDAAPAMAPIRSQLAAIHLAAGETAKAIAELRRAIALDPAHDRAAFLLVVASLAAGDFAGALETATALATRRPASAVPLNLMAAASERRGDVATAHAVYRKALTVDARDPSATYNLARLSWMAGDLDTARKQFASVLRTQPRSIPVLAALSRMAIDDGRLEEAATLLERARAADSRALGIRLALAAVYAREGRAQKALTVAEDARSIAPGNVEVLRVLGAAQLAVGHAPEALVTLRGLADREPQSAAAHFAVAQASAAAGHAQAAKRELEKVLALSPGHTGARLRLAELAVQDGELDRALAHAADLKRTDAARAAGDEIEGDAHLAGNRAVEAVHAYTRALAKDRGSRLALKLVAAHARAGNDAAADAALRDWIAGHPDDFAARLVRAGRAAHGGNLQSARADYEAVLQGAPTNVVALNNLAWLYHETGDARALEMARRAYLGFPEHHETLDTYGWLLVEDGEIEKGLTLLQSAVDAAPADAEIHYHFADALARNGQGRRARNELHALLQNDRQFGGRVAAQRLLEDLE